MYKYKYRRLFEKHFTCLTFYTFYYFTTINVEKNLFHLKSKIKLLMKNYILVIHELLRKNAEVVAK